MSKLFYLCIFFGLIAAEPTCSVPEQIFMNVNEQKIIDLEPYFQQHHKIHSSAHANLLESIGHIQKGQVQLQQALYYFFDTLIDFVVMEDDCITNDWNNLVTTVSSYVRVGLLGKLGDILNVTIVDFSKYDPLVAPEIVASFQIFQMDSSIHDERCYSLAFITPLDLILDCSYQSNPSVIENVFLYITFELYSSQVQVFKQVNLNVAQVHYVEKRKIRLITQDDGNQLLVRGHLKVNPSHQNQTYIEIFSQDEDQFELKEIMNRDYIQNSTAGNKNIQWQIIDFQVIDTELIVLTPQELVIFDSKNNGTDYKQVIPLNCTEVTSFAYEDAPDFSQIFYTACGNEINKYSESNNLWSSYFNANQSIHSVIMSKGYVLINQQSQSDVSHGKYNLQVPEKAGCFLIGTDVEKMVLQICTQEQTIRQGLILGEAIILKPLTPTKKPIQINVYTDHHQTSECLASWELNVIQETYFELVDVVHKRADLHELNSNEYNWAQDVAHIPYSDLVMGPDVTLLAAEVNGQSIKVSTNDQFYYPLTASNFTLHDDTKVLAIHKIDSQRIQVFVQDQDMISVNECLIQKTSKATSVKCSPYVGIKISSKGMLGFQSAVNQINNSTTIGIQDGSGELHLYSLRRSDASVGVLQSFTGTIISSNWVLQNDFVVVYGGVLLDLQIYDLYDLTIDIGLTILSDDFTDLVGTGKSISCVATTEDGILVTMTNTIIQIKRQEEVWQISDVVALNKPTGLKHLCYIIENQLFLSCAATSDVQVFGLSPTLYLRGQIHLDLFKPQNSIASNKYLYLIQNASVLQLTANSNVALQSSLQRVLDVSSIKQILACSFDEFDVLFTTTTAAKSSSGLHILYHRKQLEITFTSHSNEFVKSVDLQVTFTNYFNSTLKVHTTQKVINGNGQLQSVSHSNTTMDASGMQAGQVREFFLSPEDMFKGPMMNLSLVGSATMQQIAVVNRVHQVKTATQANLQDLIFYRNGKKIEAMMISADKVVALQADLVKVLKTLSLTVDRGMKLAIIHYDEDSQAVHVISEDAQKRPNSLYYGSLAVGLNQLSFTQIHLKEDPMSVVIKYICVGPYTLILYTIAQDTFIKILKVYKDTTQEVMSQSLSAGTLHNMTQISDFDAHLTTTGLHIILLDAHNGVSIIEFSKGGRLLQSAQKIKQFSIRQDLIQHYNQALFTNTKFNGIHALKGQADKDKIIRTFISTDNALQYQLNFDTVGESFSFVSSFMRFGSYACLPQQLVYVPEQNTISVVYRANKQNWAAFYNLTNAHKTGDPIPYYQVLQISDMIGGLYVKPVGSVVNTLTDEENKHPEDRPNFEATEWPFQGGLVFRSALNNSRLLLNEIQERPGLVVHNKNLTGKVDLKLQAGGLSGKVVVPLMLLFADPDDNEQVITSSSSIDTSSSTTAPQNPTQSIASNKKEKKQEPSLWDRIRLNEQILSYLFIFAGFLIFICLFCIVRCIRRSLLMREIKIKQAPDQMQEFSSENI